jgi:hypothetical protein
MTLDFPPAVGDFERAARRKIGPGLDLPAAYERGQG